MNELVKIDQSVIIVPKDFNFTNKGVVTEVSSKGFRMKMKYPTRGLHVARACDFYSHTANGILYFASCASELKDDELFIVNPIKHRFLQRRQFTRIKFAIETKMTDNEGNEYQISTKDISAGGLKFTTSKSIDLDKEYKVEITLAEEQTIYCNFQPIRMEKLDTGKVQISGRFVEQTNVEKMSLIQYCMNKNVEDKNK